MLAKVEAPRPQTDQYDRPSMREMLQVAPAMAGVMVAGVRNLAEMTDEALLRFGVGVQNKLQDVAGAVGLAGDILKSPKRLAAASIFALALYQAACAPPPSEPPRPAEVQPANAPSAAEKFATEVNQGTPPAGKVSFPFTGIPTSEAATPKPLTPETKVISAATVDMVPVSASEANEAFIKTVELEGKNKYPIPVSLGSTGQIEEYVLANGIRGLVITGLAPGTYTLLAPVDCEADGYVSKKESGVNLYPLNANMEEKYKMLIIGFPLNTQEIKPKRTTPNDRTRDSFTAGQVLATFKVNPPGVPEQVAFEEALGKPGANVAIAFTQSDGKINKESVNPSDFFLIDSKGRPLVLTPVTGKG